MLAGVSSLLSAAYFARAVTSAGALDWVVCVGLTALTWAHVFSFLDSRMPLLVADSHGVRIRLGRTWRGMAWSDLEEVEHLPRALAPRRTSGAVPRRPRRRAGDARAGRPPARRADRAAERRAVRAAAGADHAGARRTGDLTGALAALAEGRCEIVEVVPGAADRAGGMLAMNSPTARRRPGTGRARDVRAAGCRGDGQPDAQPAARRPACGPRRRRARPRAGTSRPPGRRRCPRSHTHDDVRDRRPRRLEVVDPVVGPELAAAPRAAAALGRPARRAHPDPAARDRGDRDRRLRAVRRRLLRPRPPAHPGPGAGGRRRHRCSRRTTSGTPTRRSTRAGSSRPSSPPAGTARSAA